MGELVTDALVREVREETGLVIHHPGRLLYIVQQVLLHGCIWTGFVFEVTEWSGAIAPNDPDGYILDAAFVPEPDALNRLDALPWRMMREPITSYLRQEFATPMLWLYREQPDGKVHLVANMTI